MTSQEKVIRLSPRLQAAADLVPVCETLYDIGTDHCYLPIYCIQVNRCCKAVAIDRREGPLQRAAENIDRFKLAETIVLIQQDGLQDINVSADDTVAICGLGGVETIRILQKSTCLPAHLVLQPQKDLSDLRFWLAAHGYVFERERLAAEKNRVYPVLYVRQSKTKTTLTRLEALLGPCLIQTRPQDLARYLKQEEKKLVKQSRSDESLKWLVQSIAELMEAIKDE